MTYLFSTTFFHKTAFEVPVSTNYKQYLIFLVGKCLKFLKEFGTQKILKRKKKLVQSHYPLWNNYHLWNTFYLKT